MKYSLHALLAASLVSLASMSLQAQDTATFDDLTLPSAEIDFASTLAPDSTYTFQSGPVKCYGSSNSWGSYSGFNYSNVTDDTTTSYTNDKSAITGSGFDHSENYGIAFVPIDYNGPDPSVTIPVGITLTGAAAGQRVAGAYFTNSTYAYYYMADSAFVNAHHWLQLTIKGYLNGAQTSDSVNFMLADFRDSLKINVNEWKWVDLTTLGNVDSLTFDLKSDDTGSYGINVPAYFAMDNLTIEKEESNAIAGITPDLIFNISPNPAKDYLNVSADHALNVIIYDLQGKIILQQKHIRKVNLTNFSPGIYILKAMDQKENKSGVLRFVKQ